MIGTTFGELDLNSLIDQLSQQVATTKGGNLDRLEAMLTTQATTLDLLFNRLTRQAVMNVGSYAETVEIYLKLALRAQSQARATAETLHEMKYPKPVAFFQQANIAHGAQQVNNSLGSRAEETQNAPNELKGVTHAESHSAGKLLDAGEKAAPATSSPPAEAVGIFNGTKDEDRESHHQS